MSTNSNCTTIAAPVSSPPRLIVDAQPVRALAQLAATISMTDDDLLVQAAQPYVPGTVSERLALRALALFHERTGQHVGLSVCLECGALALYEPWARETLARLAKAADLDAAA